MVTRRPVHLGARLFRVDALDASRLVDRHWLSFFVEREWVELILHDDVVLGDLLLVLGLLGALLAVRDLDVLLELRARHLNLLLAEAC